MCLCIFNEFCKYFYTSYAKDLWLGSLTFFHFPYYPLKSCHVFRIRHGLCMECIEQVFQIKSSFAFTMLLNFCDVFAFLSRVKEFSLLLTSAPSQGQHISRNLKGLELKLMR